MPNDPTALSAGATSDKVEQLVREALDRPLRVLELGCGSGHFGRRLAALYRARGWDPAAHLLAADISLATYRNDDVPARVVDLNEPLPFADGAFDLVIAIEVFEHVRAPYDLLSRLRRVLAPGGRLIFTTPNVGNVTSRLSFFVGGCHRLYPTPSTRAELAGDLVGHIQPLPVQYWHWGLRAAGFSTISVHADRLKKGASFLAVLLWPLFRLGARANRRRDDRLAPDVAAELRAATALINAFPTLASRSLVISASEARP